MIYIHFENPPTPHFIAAGNALYRKGDRHKKRSNIGVFDLLFVISGKLFIMEENQQYTIGENQLLILSPDKTHSSYRICDTETSFYWVHMGFSGAYYESEHIHPVSKVSNKSLFRDTSFYVTLPKYIQLPEDQGQFLKNYIDPLLMFSINKYDNHTEKYRQISNPLKQQQQFLNVLDMLNLDSRFSNTPDTLASEIMQYLQNNYEKNFTIQDLAQMYNFHPVHIIRCMKNSYHITPVQALTTIRLERAKELLSTTALSVSSVSESVGFSSCSYFIKKFKAHYNKTPAQYRNEIRDGLK